jgi:putative membrane protein
MRELRITVLALLTGLAACQRGVEQDETMAADTTAGVESAELTTDLLSPIRSVSLVNIDVAQIGWQQAVSGDVRQFARTVAADHRAIVGVLDSAARSRNTTLHETTDGRELAQAMRMSHAGLDNLEGADYDLAFVRGQVESHRRLVDTIDQQLAPTAVSADMRQLLRDVRAMTDAHLTRARQLLGDLLGEEVEPPPAGAAPAGTPGAAPATPPATPPPAQPPAEPQPAPPPDTLPRG